MGCKGKGPTSKRRKGLPAGPQRTPACLPVPAKTAPVAAPSPAPATDLPKGLLRPESAASLLATPRRQKLLEHIWQRIVAVAAAVRHPIPHAAGALRRVGPTIPRIGKPSPRLPRRHAGSRVGDRRLCACCGSPICCPLAAVLKTRRRSLKPDCRSRLCRAAARHRQDRRRSARRTVRRLAVAPWHGPLHQPYRFATATIGNIGSTAPRQVYSTVNCSTVMP